MNDEAAFDFDPAEHRLRVRARWAAGCVALASLLPYEVIDGHPQYLWNLAGELPPAGLVALAAPALAGLTVAIAGLRVRRATTLAIITLAALAGMAVCIVLGVDASEWGALPVPESIARRNGMGLLALAATAAGASLSFKPHARRASRVLLMVAAALALAFYMLPGRGEAPGRVVWRALMGLADLPDWRYSLGAAVLVVMVLWPGLLAVAGLRFARWPARDDHPLTAIVALYGLPLLLAMFIFRSVPGGADGWSIFVAMGGVAVLAGGVALTAAALEVSAEALGAGDEGARRGLLMAGAALVVLTTGQALLARPPPKGVDWQLQPATELADHLFEDLLPAWNRARLDWDRSARAESGASALLAVRNAAREAVEAARAVDPGLAEALAALTTGSHDLHVAGRQWYRLIGDVNQASRAAGLPYYLDPTVFFFRSAEGSGRHFRMRAHRVEAVHRYAAGGRDYATLHVRRMGGADGSTSLLGFSRDVQPFALVDLDEADDFETALASSALEDPPRCEDARRADGNEGLLRCGEVLAELLRADPRGLAPALIALTDRHELQHQIDGPHLSMASAVLDRLGHRSEALQDRVNRELSAYVAEMTTPAASPRLGLVHLVRFALNGDRGALFHIAVLAFEALGDTSLVDEDARLDRSALTATFVRLAALDEDALRARAAEAWGDLYGGSLAEVTALDATTRP